MNKIILELNSSLGHQEVELDIDKAHDFDLADFLVQMGWKAKA